MDAAFSNSVNQTSPIFKGSGLVQNGASYKLQELEAASQSPANPTSRLQKQTGKRRGAAESIRVPAVKKILPILSFWENRKRMRCSSGAV